MFRFTIRDLLLVTIIVALAVGWWLDHQRLTRDLKEVQDEADTAWHALGHQDH